MKNDTTMVIGGTGKTGGRVVERLVARGVRTRAVSRSSQIRFDWNDQSTWPAALSGVTRAYVTYYPDIAAPGAADAVRGFTAAAAESGVRRLVLLSGRGEAEAAVSEQTVRDSGLEWTVLSCAFFCQNFSEGAFADMVAGGAIMLPAGTVSEPFLDVEDIADVAVAALTEDRHVGQQYELTGSRLLTFAEAAAEISRASGREVRYVPMAGPEYTNLLVSYGLPREEATFLTELFSDVLDGRNEHVTDGVRRAIGRDPRDFAEYAARTWKG